MMRGIILAGGTGLRLQPLTSVTNKCLLPVGKKPLICHCIDILVESGIEDIMLITGPEHMGHVTSLLGSGINYDCQLTYRVQDKADGIAAALKLCKNFVANEKFVVLLGDNLFSDKNELTTEIKKFMKSSDDYKLFTKSVADPHRFGVALYNNGKIVDIVEKPKDPPSDQAIVGVYCYTHNVFDIIKDLKMSARGEYEITDVNSHLVKNNSGDHYQLKCEWIDAGTHDSYRKANEMIWRTAP